MPQGWNPVGLQTPGSSVSFQTSAGTETNLPSNLLLTEIKHKTESATADPKVKAILKALLSPSLWPLLAQVSLPSDTNPCSPWTAEQGLSSCGEPFNVGLAETSTGMKAAPLPRFPEKGRAVREGKGCRTLGTSLLSAWHQGSSHGALPGAAPHAVGSAACPQPWHRCPTLCWHHASRVTGFSEGSAAVEIPHVRPSAGAAPPQHPEKAEGCPQAGLCLCWAAWRAAVSRLCRSPEQALAALEAELPAHRGPLSVPCSWD